MKYIIAMITSLLIIASTNTIKAQNEVDLFEVQVDGLGCPFCAFGLEKKFKEFETITDIKIEMETGVMTFNFPTIEFLSTDDVEKQVDAAGYTAVNVRVIRADGSIEETTEAEETDVDSDKDHLIKASFFISGNCEMCKTRIEKTANQIDGVSSAEWNIESKQISVKFDPSLTSQALIEKAIAQAGHDSVSAKTDSETYDALPGCCQYEREQ